MDDRTLFTFKTKNVNEPPTEQIALSDINSVESVSSSEFAIKTDSKYHFRTDSESKKTKWIDLLNKYRMNCIDIPIQISCPRDHQFDEAFTLRVPYDDEYPYSVHSLIEDIMDYLHRQHRDLNLIPSRIHSDSFLGQQIVYRDYDWNESVVNLKSFPQIVLEQIGIVMDIDIDIYEHNPRTLRSKCPDTFHFILVKAFCSKTI